MIVDPTGHFVTLTESDPPEPLTENVCDVCFGDNLLKEVGINECDRCKKPFCIHYASNIDPQYCVDCMSDMNVSVEKIYKIHEVEDDQTEEKRIYLRRARRINIKGQDWLFAQRKINTLTDAEATVAMEYHRAMFRLLATDSEQRKTANAHRNAAVKITSSTTSTVTTVKKTTETKSSKPTAQMSAMLTALLGQGMKPEDIAAAIKAIREKQRA